MNRVIYILIIALGVSSCTKDKDIELEHYIRFVANEKMYELEFVDCYYINESSIEKYQNMTFIYGYKSAQEKRNDENEIYLETELPFFNVIIPSSSSGSWSQTDTIYYSIEVDKGIGFTKLDIENPYDSKLDITITEYGDIGGNCIGTFSGQLTNEYGDELKIENGKFKIKITE